MRPTHLGAPAAAQRRLLRGLFFWGLWMMTAKSRAAWGPWIPADHASLRWEGRTRSAAERSTLYDWSGGLVWASTPATDDCGAAVVRGALIEGGHATLMRAPADARARLDVFQPLPEAVMKLTRGIKASFDPDGVLNPGRMYAGV